MKAAAPVPAAGEDDVFLDGGGEENAEDNNLYDRPPASRGSTKLDLMVTVPVRANAGGNKSDDESYDVPPSALYRNQSPRPKPERPDSQASSDDQSIGAGGPRECYDYPPKRLDSTTSSDNELLGQTPPARPPKPINPLSQYQNLPSRKSEVARLGHGNSLRGHPTPPLNSDPADLMNLVLAPPKPHKTAVGSGYDVPRSSSHRPAKAMHQRSHIMSSTVVQGISSTVVPPPPVPKRPSESGLLTPLYLNAPEVGLSSGNVAGPENGSGGVGSGDTTDSPLNLVPPAIPPPRHGSSGESQDSRSDRDSPQPLHQSPPPPPAPLSASPAAPAVPPARLPSRPHGPSVSPRSMEGATDSREEGSVIFSTQRTRSFKRQHQVNHGSPKMSNKSKSQTLQMAVHVPAPRPVVPARQLDTSTSDDEDDAMKQRLRIPDQEEETHHSLSLLHSVPPAVNDDKQLKYIDLALPNTSQEPFVHPPRSSHNHSHTGASHTQVDRSKDQATEYREIDFVKTQALNNAKREKEKERQSDDHN
ncbi:protein daughter of sevenless [Plakobranchus ocellatus]|uniref:Protein daughter of sevenless n=1 Tax=Plakobranchus ocellatus TaxID=259542 RepID=A0AAV3Y0V7_9GAST|nr:protein daughter of sevenless [Plakobranchus ocellatus]